MKFLLLHVDDYRICFWMVDAARYPALNIYRDDEGRYDMFFVGSGVTTVPQERLDEVWCAATAYHALTGSVEGFPEQEFDL